MSLDDLKNRIKDDLPISAVIGQYIPLQRSGAGLVALCPFHQDSKPSMNVNDSKKIYKCFACGAAGDAITFVQKYRGLDFVEALKEICQKNGMSFESYQEEKRTNPKVEMAKRILSYAARIYRETGKSKNFPPFNEFMQKRGLTEETATTYSLGFASNRSILSEFLKTKVEEKDRKFARDIALEIGIIKKDRNNAEETYDTFRDRIMFPIWDFNGSVIGFTSRSIRDGQNPKYLNSGDSVIFNKRTLLYGFHLAKSHIREKNSAIVVEGNMDQIALYQYGFKNAVAIQGTAMGDQALARLLSITKNIYIALDNDGAGYKAAERLNAQLLEQGVLGYFVNFEPVKDADDFLKEVGGIELQKRLENAKPMLDVMLEKAFPEKVPELSHKKLEVLQSAFELVKPLGMNLAATERITDFAKRLGMSSDATQIVKTYEDYLKKQRRPQREMVKNTAQKDQTTRNENEAEFGLELLEEEALKTKNTEANPAEKKLAVIQLKSERQLLQELVQNPSAFSSNLVSEILDLLPSDEVKKYITRLKRLVFEIDESEYVSMVSNMMTNEDVPLEIKEAVSAALFQYKPRNADEKVVSRLFFDLKIKVKTEVLKNRKDDLKKKQDQLQTKPEFDELLAEINQIDRELQEIKKLKHK